MRGLLFRHQGMGIGVDILRQAQLPTQCDRVRHHHRAVHQSHLSRVDVIRFRPGCGVGIRATISAAEALHLDSARATTTRLTTLIAK